MKNNEDDFFGFGKPFKTRRFYICKTGGMSLWVALNTVGVQGFCRGRGTREEHKKAVLSWSSDVTNCRCKNCRYFRFATGKKKE